MTGTPECDVRGCRGGVWSVVAGAELVSADAGVGITGAPGGYTGALGDDWSWITVPSASSGRWA